MKKFIIAILLMVAGARAQSINVKSINSTRYTDQYAAGSNTGGIVEAYAACPSTTGCTVVLGTDITIATPQTLTVADNKPLVLNLNGHAITVTNGSGIGLLFADNNMGIRTRFRIEHGVMACTWSASSLTGYKFSAMTEVSVEDVKFQNCDHSGTAVLWDDVEDASMKDVTFRSNGLGFQGQNATNQVAFDNVHWDSNVNAILFKDAGGITFKDCLIQSNTGQHAVSFITTAGNNATELIIKQSHFENNGDGTAASRQIYIAPASSQLYLNVDIEGNVFTRGASAPGSIPVEIAGSQNVQPLKMEMNQYNGYAGAVLTGNLNHLVTTIGENSTGAQDCDVCINSNTIPGIVFNPNSNNRKFQIFGGYSGTFQGFLQIWDLTANASLLAYNGTSSQWQTNKAFFVGSGAALAGFSDTFSTETYNLDSSTGILTNYHNWVDASNYERLFSGWSNGDTAFKIATAKLGTGTDRDLIVGTSGSANLTFETNGALRWQITSAGVLQTSVDNTTDIGTSSNFRPRTLYTATSVVTPLLSQTDSDTGTLISSFNSSASNAAEFVLKHNLTDVEFDNLRGGFIFTPSGGTNKFALGLQTTSGVVDFTASSHTIPIKSGTISAKPATCTFTAGAALELYVATDATAGQNMFFCTATNTWTQQLNTGVSTTYQVDAVNLTSTTTINWQDGANITVTNPSAGNVAFAVTGTLPAARFPAFTGDCTSSAGFVALTCGGAIARTGNSLAQFASTTSAQLATVLSDETGGSGVVVFSASPTLTGTLTAAGITATGGAIDFTGATHTSPIKSGTTAAKPATCTFTAGSAMEVYLATDATAGQNIFFCTATNTWTQQSGGAGGGTVTHSGTLTASNIIIGNGGADITPSIVTIDGSGNISTTGSLTASSVVTSGASQWDGTEAAAPLAPVAAHWLFYPLTSLGFGQEDSAGTKTYIGAELPNLQTGSSYPVVSADRAKLITFSSTSAVTLPQAGTTGFPNGFYVDIESRGTGGVSITPTTSTVDGFASFTVLQNQGVRLVSDGTNWYTLRGSSSGTYVVLTATASLTAGQVVKVDTANANSAVIATTTDTGAGIPIGFVINSPGVAGAAQIITSGIITSPVLGTGTCSIGNFVLVDTTTNGRVKCGAYAAGTVLGTALTAQASVGSTVTVLVQPR
jgi:hypothetical protein